YKADGTPAKNQWIDNTYWVGQDGKMARNAWVDNGKYYVGADGKWIPNHLKRS
ncbi:choline-binding protein, partial [Streptococcus anginosus]